ncbi:unnamed protein product [Owenia fusiformis]|uniref:F-box domain-containing protein n=2 Tax=Owenia fusiformis TaxID=6347 RepID=A0A8S4P627_OWEFU|nr:unnamed protein product [Owenia fusiformis]
MAENQSNSSTGMSSNVTHKRRCPWEAESLNNPAKIHDSSSEHRRRGNANELNVTSSKPCIHLYKGKIDEFHINNLPENLLLCIFKKLPLYDLLHRMALVCQYWNKLSKDQDLWRNIDLRTHMKVNDVILLKLLSYSDNVTSLNITDVRLVTTIGFQASLNQCTRLKCLVANR